MQGEISAGSVVWDLDADDASYNAKMAKAATTAKSTAQSVDGVLGKLASSVASGFAKVASSVASITFDSVQTGAIAAGTALTALGIKGISSASQLQSLQISLNGLTHSINLGAQAMAGAYAYAQKAPFQLPEVASTTKTLIAYGIAANDAVGYLDLLGNISITTGVNIESLGQIFGQVSAQGRLMGEDILQLTQNGVAILPALEKQLGKTADQIRDLASQGQISFDQFRTALASLVDPSVLDQLTNTLPRQLDRLNGSLRILSNSFVGVGVSATAGFKTASDGLNQAVIDVTKAAADALRSGPLLEAATQIGNSFAVIVRAAVPTIQPLVNGIAAITTGVTNLGALALPLLGLAIGGFGHLADGIPIIGELLGGLTGPIGLVAGAVSSLILLSPDLRKAFQDATAPIKDAFDQVNGAAGGLVKSLDDTFKAIGSALAPTIVPLITSITGLITAFAPLGTFLSSFSVQIVQQLVVPAIGALTVVLNALAPIASTIGQVFSALGPSFQQLLSAIGPVLQSLAGAIQGALGPLIQVFGDIAKSLGGVLLQALTAILPVIGQTAQLLVPVIGALGKAFDQVLQALIPLIPPLVQLAIDIFQNILKPLLPVIVQAIGIVATLFTQVFQALAPLLPALSTLAIDILQKVLAPILQAVSAQLPTLANAFGQIVGAIAPLLPVIVQFVTVLVNSLAPILPPLIQFLTQIATAVIQQALLPALNALKPIFPVIIGAFVQIVDAVTPLIPLILNLASQLLKSLLPVLPSLVNSFIELVLALVPLIPPLVQLVVMILPPLIGLISFLGPVIIKVLVASLLILVEIFVKIIEVIAQVIQKGLQFSTDIVNAFNGAYQGIKGFVGSVIQDVGKIFTFFGQVGSNVKAAFGDAVTILYDVGKQLIQGLLNGAGSLLSKIGDFFLNMLPSFIKEPFKKALGIHSPSKLFEGFGTNVVQGLVNGITGSSGMVSKVMGALSDQMAVSSSLAMADGVGGQPTSSVAAGLVPTSSAQPTVIHLHLDGVMARSRGDLRDIAKDMVESINEELRANRKPEIGGGNLTSIGVAA